MRTQFYCYAYTPFFSRMTQSLFICVYIYYISNRKQSNMSQSITSFLFTFVHVLIVFLALWSFRGNCNYLFWPIAWSSCFHFYKRFFIFRTPIPFSIADEWVCNIIRRIEMSMNQFTFLRHKNIFHSRWRLKQITGKRYINRVNLKVHVKASKLNALFSLLPLLVSIKNSLNIQWCYQIIRVNMQVTIISWFFSHLNKIVLDGIKF